jgi:hypothetical protein
VNTRRWPALTAVVILVGCSGAPSPAPEPAPSSSTAPASTTPRERDAIDLALDAAWDSDPHRYACGAIVQPVIDSLADVVQTVVETDRLSAVLMAQQYRRERCPSR